MKGTRKLKCFRLGWTSSFLLLLGLAVFSVFLLWGWFIGSLDPPLPDRAILSDIQKILSAGSLPNDSFSWVIGAYTLDYVIASVPLIYSLQHLHHSIIPITVLTDPEHCSATKALGKMMGFNTYCPDQMVECKKDSTYKDGMTYATRFKGTQLKFEIFRMHNFKRIVYLDADTLALSNSDALFTCDSDPSTICASLNNEGVWRPSYSRKQGINAGVLVVTPDTRAYEVLSRDFGKNAICSDQINFNEAIGKNELKIRLISNAYNFRSETVDELEKMGKVIPDIKIFHFAARWKPWLTDLAPESSVEAIMSSIWKSIFRKTCPTLKGLEPFARHPMVLRLCSDATT